MNNKTEHIFIVGSSRSGTTMMSRMMNAHSSIYTFNELHFFEQICSADDLWIEVDDKAQQKLLQRLMAIQRDNYLLYDDIKKYESEAETHLTNKSFSNIDLFRSFLKYESSLNGKSISCDHTPRNVFYIEEILRHMPNAKIVVMLRDGRDVLLSQKRKWKRKFLGYNKIPYKEALRSYLNYHPIIISKLWSSAVLAAEKYKGHNKVHHVRYEDLVSNPNAETRKIMQFLNVDFEKEQLEIPFEGSSNQTDEKHIKGVDAKRKHVWKSGGLSKAELYWFEKIGQQAMESNKYNAQNNSFNIGAFYYLLTFPVVVATALLMNLNRMSNIIEAIKKRI